MIQKFKNSLLVLAMLALPGFALFSPGLVGASSIAESVCKGTNIATNTDVTGGAGDECTEAGGGTSVSGLYELAANIVDIFSVIVGIIAVIMIIYGGFKYITSGGDSGNVSGAKNTLIYAIVGLIIVALAQFIVRFVLNTTAGVAGS